MIRRRRRDDGMNGRRNRLVRDTENAMFFGVCAGAADYFGFDVQLTRICVAIGGFFFFPTVPIIYLILGFLLDEAPGAPKKPEKPEQPERRREDPELRRRVRSEPQAMLRSVRHRFRELDRRMQRLEKHVTSKKYNLQREIDGLRD